MKPSTSYIGVDVGTSGCKAVLLGSEGAVLHTAIAGYPTRRTIAGEVTQDPADWLRAVRSTLRACAAAADGRSIDGIGITAPAHVGVLTGADGRPLTRSLLAFDGRPGPLVEELRNRYGQEYLERTFVRLSAAWTLPQLAWQRRATPELWSQIRWLLTQKDWVRYQLTGVALIDESDAAGTGMVDQREKRWLDAVCSDVGLGASQLPPIVPSTWPGGQLGRSWARSCGLKAGIPVVVGATDTAAELVSVAANRAGASLVKIASTGTVVGVSAEPVTDPRLMTYPHALPGLWYTLGATSTAAVAYQWLRETVFASPPDAPAVAYAEMDRIASAAPAGAGGVLFLPFLSGERTPYWDPRLRAAFVGISSSHRREHLARAVLEGVAFALRACRDVVEAAGIPVSHPILAGGGTTSQLWRRILVSVLGQPGRITEVQGPAVGAAMLAASAGARTAAEVTAAAPRVALRDVKPVDTWMDRYAATYPIYVKAASQLAEVSHDLVGIAAP
jgi:xylulokinase